MSVSRNPKLIARIGPAAVCLSLALPVFAAADDPFPRTRPGDSFEAANALSPGSSPLRCLSGRIQETRGPRFESDASSRRALTLLRNRVPFSGSEETLAVPGGAVLRYTRDDGSIDRISDTDSDADGRPDLLQATLDGLDAARRLLHDRLGLPAADAADILLVELGSNLDGYVVPARRGARQRLVLDVTPIDGLAGARRSAAHQYAHAVALSVHPHFPARWAEALATWATLSVEGQPDSATEALLSRRLNHLGSGLDVHALDLAAGNALWFAFLEEAYGALAVRLTVEELAAGAAVPIALDRALRRSSDHDLAAAFRDFHLWSLLVGEAADGNHFPFADRLHRPAFASRAEGLPALSVQSDPAVARLGATQVALRPTGTDGGLRVRFEGEFSAEWAVDLLLLHDDGTKHRLAIPLTEGRGDRTVPLEGLDDAWLLIRNLSSDEGVPRRYTYAAHREPDFPFALDSLDAEVAPRGILLSWETSSERQMVGFNVVRTLESGGPAAVINPVWVPAFGDSTTATAYRFLDRSAEPGTAYVYRLQGITTDGLTTTSEPLTIRNPPRSN